MSLAEVLPLKTVSQAIDKKPGLAYRQIFVTAALVFLLTEVLRGKR